VPVPATASAPAAANRDLRFESAKAASMQRTITTAATLDSMATVAGQREGKTTRHVEGRTFELRDGVWTDARYEADMPKTTIKPFSKAYFDLIEQLPELRPAFALGERVIVAGRSRAIELKDSGASELAPAALAALIKAW
jgi:hypothetical protein